MGKHEEKDFEPLTHSFNGVLVLPRYELDGNFVIGNDGYPYGFGTLIWRRGVKRLVVLGG